MTILTLKRKVFPSNNVEGHQRYTPCCLDVYYQCYIATTQLLQCCFLVQLVSFAVSKKEQFALHFDRDFILQIFNMQKSILKKIQASFILNMFFESR